MARRGIPVIAVERTYGRNKPEVSHILERFGDWTKVQWQIAREEATDDSAGRVRGFDARPRRVRLAARHPDLRLQAIVRRGCAPYLLQWTLVQPFSRRPGATAEAGGSAPVSTWLQGARRSLCGSASQQGAASEER